jgi:hypothetical protein
MKEQDALNPGRQEKHALAIARWEDNRESWLEGEYFGLASRKPYLQKLVGDGGTLWIVVSRPRPEGGRLYSLSFRLEKCRKITYPQGGKFGKYVVAGDINQSTLFANNDAKLLLLSLRFKPYRPIRSADLIGQSLQTPRLLGMDDVQLLTEQAAAADRWSVFISYQHDDQEIAGRLSEDLQRSGIPVFRDKEALRAGEEWWPALQRAIARSRFFVLLLGTKTNDSEWVKRELAVAEKEGIPIIPVLAGGKFKDCAEFSKLKNRHALTIEPDQWQSFMNDMLRAIR